MSDRIVNEAAEEAVLAALVVDPTRIPVLADKLRTEDFGVAANRRMYDAMLRLSQEHRRVDAITLRSEGVDAGYVLDNLHGTSERALDEYVDLLVDSSFRRRVDEHGADLQRIARTAGGQAEILGELQAFNQGLARDGRDHRLVDAARAVDLYAAELRARKVRGLGLTYGVPALDARLQPAEGGDLIVVAARPSIGKTALAESICEHWSAGAERPVLFASLEMRLFKLMDRGVSRWSGVPSWAILRGETTAEEDALIADALERRKVLNIEWLDDPFGTTFSLRAAATRTALIHGLTGIVVDYIQILNDAGDQETQRVTRISRNLKAIAREHDVPMLALSQLSRQSEYRKDPHPRLHDIRESGAIEQDADVVLGLYRSRGSGKLDIDVLKNRQGPADTRISVRFDLDTISFGDEIPEYGEAA